MNKYSIRFNKTRGQPGRGSVDHVWRVFENGKEYLFKNLDITAPTKSERDPNGVDYNICCQGFMHIDKETSTAVIGQKAKKSEMKDWLIAFIAAASLVWLVLWGAYIFVTAYRG